MPSTCRPKPLATTPRLGVGTLLCVSFCVLLLSPACGASLNAVYEGDVRFEHCMGLDEEVAIKAKIRRACWEEWTKFYTFGQTRDRVEYAKHRVRQLKQLHGEDEVELAVVGPSAPLAVPEPTSALAPPPMMLVTDAGSTADAGDSGTDADVDAPLVLPASGCTSLCEKAFVECGPACTTPRCNSACTQVYKRCMRKCF